MGTAVVEVLGSPWAGRHPPRSHAALVEAYLAGGVVRLLVDRLKADARAVAAAGLLNRLVQCSDVAGQQLVAADGLQAQLLARCGGGVWGSWRDDATTHVQCIWHVWQCIWHVWRVDDCC